MAEVGGEYRGTLPVFAFDIGAVDVDRQNDPSRAKGDHCCRGNFNALIATAHEPPAKQIDSEAAREGLPDAKIRGCATK